jgi:uncharacterized protein (DUF1499 family)
MNILKIIGIAAGIAVAGLAGLAVTNPGNLAETLEDGADQAMRARKYRTTLENFVAETEKIIPALTKYGQNWRLISSETTGAAAVIKAEVPVVVFTDDLEVKAVAEGGDTLVNIRSNSRVGKSDLGENRRHVRQLLRALDEKFGAQ